MELLTPIKIRLILFLLLSTGLAIVSRRPLRNPRSHGFYRFLAFEAILFLVLLNVPYWFKQPNSLHQIVSWLLLSASLFLVLDGLFLLKKRGGHQPRQEAPENFAFENTARLVSSGVYRYIRHPMYASLLFLAWGAAAKHFSPPALAGAGLTTILLVATAKVEERESVAFFGTSYLSYRRRTKMFIPFLF